MLNLLKRKVLGRLLTTLKFILVLALESTIISPIQLMYSLWTALLKWIRGCISVDFNKVMLYHGDEVKNILLALLLIAAPFIGVLIILVIRIINSIM